MIPDRAPQPKRSCLTKLCYQEPPMIPKTPSNMEQKRIVAESKDLPKPPAVKKAKPAAKRPVKGTRSQTMINKHNDRILEEVSKVFRNGPITIEQLQKKYKIKSRPTANAKMNLWRRKGLVKVVGEVFTKTQPGVQGGHSRTAKLWGKV